MNDDIRLKKEANEIAKTVPYSSDEVYKYLYVYNKGYINGGYGQIEAVDLAKIATVNFLNIKMIKGY